MTAVADPEDRIVQKIGNFTSKNSHNGLKLSQLTLGNSERANDAIGSMLDDGLLEEVDGEGERFRLTQRGWREYHELDL